MKRVLIFLALALLAVGGQAAPLRVFIRGGESNRGQQVHAHPRFLADWTKLLAERGIQASGGTNWPTAEQIAATDVIVAYAQEGGDATPEQEKLIEDFVKRGGGLVVIHTAAVSMKNPGWWRDLIGGAWVPGKTKWREGKMDLYYVENQYIGGGHAITKGASNFHFDDEIYYDMDIKPEARVLATSYTPNVKEGKRPAEGGKPNIYDIQAQMWAYERTFDGGKQPYRAFVTIPGHQYATFERPNYRAILLRGIAWAGQRPNVDEFCKPEELSALTYPDGGPQTPAATLKNLEVHPDFNLTLVAAEPLITKPMNFDWAPDGSLWVAETPEYPNGRRGMRPDYRGKEWKDHGGIDPQPGIQNRAGLDKVSRLVDSNGDGVMDKKEVFYEGLDLVTGLVFHGDGVIVTQAPDILWLRDTNNDGKADKVEKLYTGLGTGDTHAVINNPRWGWDGWIYATHGYSASDRVKNVKDETQPKIGSGVVRFKPDGSAMEQYSSKGGNTWGLTITGDNRVMWTQPTSGQLLMHTILPEYALARGKVGNTNSFKVVEPSPKAFPLIGWEQLAYVQIDWVGSFTAAAGTVVYDGGAWPAEYNGDYFTTEPTINLIHHTRLTPEGSSYTAKKLPGREETEFIRSKDMWWRPIEVRVGPDGAVYVGDFYNQAVIHNDTRGPDHNVVNAAVRPDRDHYFGRIWKIEHKQSKKLAVPNLGKAGVPELVKALQNPNRHVRMNASRLLIEKKAGGAELEQLLQSSNPDAQIAAMWTLFNLGRTGKLYAPVHDKNSAVRRNAVHVMEAAMGGTRKDEVTLNPGDLAKLLGDTDGQVRLATLRALGQMNLSDTNAPVLVAAWGKFDDDFQRSAAIGAASRIPAAVIAAALDSTDAQALTPLVSALTQTISGGEDAAKLVVALSAKPASADALKKSILEGLGKTVKETPAMTPELGAALGKLLASGASSSALPLAAKWDKAGTLKGEVAKVTTALVATLNDTKEADGARLNAAQSLLGLRSTDEKILPSVIDQLGKDGTGPFKRALVGVLAETTEPATGVALSAAFNKLPADAQPVAFDAILKRADWTNAFLDAVKAKQVDPVVLGPASAYRLRTHPDRGVAKKATDMLDELNPMAKMKKETIAKLAAAVEEKGNVANGKVLFTTTCAICHKFGEIGTDVGPGLTGMGTHGAGELLTAIVDPNAEVDPSFVTWNIETKDGQSYAGIISAENPTSVTLKSLAGVQEVKVANIKSRVNTNRSLMPEGLEGLGPEQLRDIITYMQATDGGKFRTIDLSKVYTANTGRGLYISEANTNDTLKFAKTGHVSVDGVPFNVLAPDKVPLNVLLLKGGQEGSFAKSMPQKVDVSVGGFVANRLHFLGGIAGWGFPFGGEGEVVMSVTVHFADGQRETLQLKNGVEFADYIREVNVPGSKLTKGIVKANQLRWFTKELTRTGPIDRLTLESANTGVAPTTVAITAELGDPNAPKPAGAANAKPAPSGEPDFKPQFTDPVPQPPATKPAKGPRVLLVGGGSSHDFVKFFGAADKAILADQAGWVDFTQNANGVPAILDRVDVLVWSANQPISAATRAALMEYANSGRGLIAFHPGCWYAWNNFPDWNKVVIGGGSRGHDKFGEFEVKATGVEHPIMAGVPASFRITDELYYYKPDENGTPIEVLATATSTQKPGTYPQVFVVKNPKSRICGITLGHDAKAHDLPAFQTLLRNAVKWAAGK
jgi:putative membrane-bound dehydrogenase-like protein